MLRGEKLGDGVGGGGEEFLLGGAEAELVPAVHFARVGQGLSEGVFGEVALYPGGEEEGDGTLVSGIEIVAETPKAQGVVSVVEGPEEASEVNPGVRVRVFGDRGGDEMQGGGGVFASGGLAGDLGLGLEAGGVDQGLEDESEGGGVGLGDVSTPGDGSIPGQRRELIGEDLELGSAIGEGAGTSRVKAPLGEPLWDPVVLRLRTVGLCWVHGGSCFVSVVDRARGPVVLVDAGRFAVLLLHPAVGGERLRIDCGSIPRRPCNL